MEEKGSNYRCKFSFVQQQAQCGVTLGAVVEVHQGAVEYQVDLQFVTALQFHKLFVL